ncbi:hypothetical protein RvY_15130 [Ramazzottius varieornatus]|uniref:CHHC U11-48K-type domain-containing protein n=1 Tax=Ramazzottius varieornatus TaxID=947166 RepID=A0A1D1VTV4_RAMVA|nr:hypothetical protein RvY_15130 [Ramazzottius varieornatus]
MEPMVKDWSPEHVNVEFTDTFLISAKNLDEEVSCPYNLVHRVSLVDLKLHLARCPSEKKAIQQCQFNQHHWFPVEDAQDFIHHCVCPNNPGKYDVLQKLSSDLLMTPLAIACAEVVQNGPREDRFHRERAVFLTRKAVIAAANKSNLPGLADMFL